MVIRREAYERKKVTREERQCHLQYPARGHGEGIWDKQTNLVEAIKIVDIIKDLTKKFPEKELGIVTFNAKQQDLILDVLDNRTNEEGFVRPGSLIVKNIENIQGDEKDIIIFSTGYAPDSKGKLIMQFGSLNLANGENRLNVAITRAREKVIIVSSIWPNELKVTSSKNEGPKLLKAYMEYAKMVSDGEFKPQPTPKVNNSADWYLKTKLEKWLETEVECDAKEELPFADLTISKNQDYIGVISTDDDLYYQSPSVKDAHVYTPFTLSAKH